MVPKVSTRRNIANSFMKKEVQCLQWHVYNTAVKYIAQNLIHIPCTSAKKEGHSKQSSTPGANS